LPEKLFFGRSKILTMAPRHLALLALLVILGGCVQQAAQPVLEFSTGACTRDIDAYSPPEAGITGTAWANDYTFQADGFVKTYCGGAEITGDYALNGKTLTLFYTITTPGPVTSCLCARGVRYRITDLPYGEYRVVMEKR
jgi:hypothetical protein